MAAKFRSIEWDLYAKRSLGVAFVLIGLAGIVTGFARILTDNETMRGSADIIIAGFVALQGVGHWQEA